MIGKGRKSRERRKRERWIDTGSLAVCHQEKAEKVVGEGRVVLKAKWLGLHRVTCGRKNHEATGVSRRPWNLLGGRNHSPIIWRLG